MPPNIKREPLRSSERLPTKRRRSYRVEPAEKPGYDYDEVPVIDDDLDKVKAAVYEVTEDLELRIDKLEY